MPNVENQKYFGARFHAYREQELPHRLASQSERRRPRNDQTLCIMASRHPIPVPPATLGQWRQSEDAQERQD